jgi:hypothetical protein
MSIQSVTVAGGVILTVRYLQVLVPRTLTNASLVALEKRGYQLRAECGASCLPSPPDDVIFESKDALLVGRFLEEAGLTLLGWERFAALAASGVRIVAQAAGWRTLYLSDFQVLIPRTLSSAALASLHERSLVLRGDYA